MSPLELVQTVFFTLWVKTNPIIAKKGYFRLFKRLGVKNGYEIMPTIAQFFMQIL
jgi:hypothetical protein